MKRSFTGLLIQIEKKVWRDVDTGLYVSHCDPLDVCSQGDTEEEAVENLIEAVQIFLSTCYEMGTLNEVLKECGLTPSDNGEEHMNGVTEIDSLVVLREEDYGCLNSGFQNQKKQLASSSYTAGNVPVRKDPTSR